MNFWIVHYLIEILVGFHSIAEYASTHADTEFDLDKDLVESGIKAAIDLD